jgi:hypothetical protein
VGDILLENMDFPGADKVAKRLKLLLPPAIQQAEGIQGVPGPQPNPLDDEEKKAKIENLRATATAALIKAGVTQQDSRMGAIELLLQALENIHQSATDMTQPNPGAQAQPGSPPVSPAQPPAQPQGGPAGL